MRIGLLDLIGYGHFTNRSIELPARQPDLHLVHGPNEAGKSTALSAVEDLLFGIPRNSSLNFLHDYAAMRIGAVLEAGDRRLAFRRRKGNKNTLLDEDDNALDGGEATLGSLLGGADRDFLTRMFSLDHRRLHEGGQEILAARDDVGQAIFAAGAGLSGLRERAQELDREADALWAPRRAAKREYYQAEDALKEAKAALREHTLTVANWQALKRRREEAEAAHGQVESLYRAASAERQKLERVRRVFPHVHRRRELEQRLAELGEVTMLPEEAAADLAGIDRAVVEARRNIETLSGQLDTAREDLAAETFDEALLRHEETVRDLHEKRIAIRREQADMPKRRAELEQYRSSLARLARELGWAGDDADALMARLPGRPEVSTVRSLANAHGALATGLETANELLDEARREQRAVEQRLAAAPEPVDISMLDAVIGSVREPGDLPARIEAAQSARDSHAARLPRGLRELEPAVDDPDALATMPVPTKAAIHDARRIGEKAHRALEGAKQKAQDQDRELDRLRREKEHLLADEGAVAREALDAARERRELGWSLVRRRFIDEGAPPAPSEIEAFAGADDLASAYEQAVCSADELSDRRFGQAEAAASLAQVERQIADAEHDLQSRRNDAAEAEAAWGSWLAEWRAMWREAPFEPAEPLLMSEWMETRDRIVDDLEARNTAERDIARLTEQQGEARDRLLAALAEVEGTDENLANQPLSVALGRADDVRTRHAGNAEARRRLEEERDDTARLVERREHEVRRAGEKLDAWRDKWRTGVGALGLDPESEVDAVSAQVERLEEMRDVSGKLLEVRDRRVATIERDVATFEAEVARFVAGVAPDLAAQAPEEAVVALEARLDESRAARTRHDEKAKTAARLEEQIATHKRTREEAGAKTAVLREMASVADDEALRAAIATSDEARNLHAELEACEAALTREGDGLAIEELVEACRDIDIDALPARIEQLGQEREEHRRRLGETGEERQEARRAFAAAGGDDAAARAAADREAAAAEMRRVAERYVRLRASVKLLRWALDRHRREKQAPVLRRAGELFSTLTEGSFARLDLSWADDDNPVLVGVRLDGSQVEVAGMSSGSADQLYLALRVASVEDYLARAEPLPFVADDLFVNFDDQRAAAGFRVLAELAQRTQVLFFTHHQHLIEVAERALGGNVALIRLEARSGGR